LIAVEKWGVGGKGVKDVMEGVEQIKVKYTHSGVY
jgi:hypothetical protein